MRVGHSVGACPTWWSGGGGSILGCAGRGEAVGVGAGVDDVGAEGEAVHDSGGQAGSGKVLPHSTERGVGGTGDRGPLLAGCDDLEEQLGAAGVEADVANFVQAQQVQAGVTAYRRESCFSSAASTSSLTRAAVVTYRTRRPCSAAAVPSAMSRCVFPVPESPSRTRGSPASIQAPPARWPRVAGVRSGTAVTSKPSRRLVRGTWPR